MYSDFNPFYPVNPENFFNPPREFGILPFWFLNGELDPEEMRFQLEELRRKGMAGVILHGRFGLEMPYLGHTYLERIRMAVDWAKSLGLKTWIYDEMNWPSGTADKRVLRARPDLAQRYIECIHFGVRGPWFLYLTGEDSRYLDFERSTPLAAFAISSAGEIVDLTPNLSFRDVIPWSVPPGNWRLMYIVEKKADYYIDALNPEATSEFLRLGYEPYVQAIGDDLAAQIVGFYTDEPAMHYYLTGSDNAVVPWTFQMLHHFQEHNGYNLRPRLPDLFFDLSPQSACVRFDFYRTITTLYSQAYYRQIHDWCRDRGVLFTGHLLYEELLRQMVRTEGNIFRHYPHFDVVGVDHLYPIIGDRDRPGEHVSLKVASSAAHLQGSPRLLCESFGGIGMDATMQRMKWIADWQYVLGVNLLNPHGFHYTLEGPRKRDWPPSQFYQYPWWQYYGEFSRYISRLSHLLSGGKHIARVAVLWPINAIFANYTPQSRNPLSERMEQDFNVLTDLLLRLHYDFDYLDEDTLAAAKIERGILTVSTEAYDLLVIPPMTHLKLSSLACLERFLASGGNLLGLIFLPNFAFETRSSGSVLLDVGGRIQALFGVNPAESQRDFEAYTNIDLVTCEHPGRGKTVFFRSYALNRQLPLRWQQQLGILGKPENPAFLIEHESGRPRYYFAPPDGPRQDITKEVQAERTMVEDQLQQALEALVEVDITIDNREIFYLHRTKDGKDIYFLANPTMSSQLAQVSVPGEVQPVCWDPSTGLQGPILPSRHIDDRTQFRIKSPPAGSLFILLEKVTGTRISAANITIETVREDQVVGYGRVVGEARIEFVRDGQAYQKAIPMAEPAEICVLDGDWGFEPQTHNALVLHNWLAIQEISGEKQSRYTDPGANTTGWLEMVPGAWAYQLPAEPTDPYPVPVWYRVSFQVEKLPPRVDLIIDGFAGSSWQVFVNKEAVHASPGRSRFDAQMLALDISPHLCQGENLIAVRLVLTEPTDGLLDLIKIVGDFSLAHLDRKGYAITSPRPTIWPGPWTSQGYPYYSGCAIYRRRFVLPETYRNQRIFLEPAMQDDVLEVIVNGKPAGTRLWAPYKMEISAYLQPGENLLELRVANTLANLLDGTERPSGLAGPPRLVPYQPIFLDFHEEGSMEVSK